MNIDPPPPPDEQKPPSADERERMKEALEAAKTGDVEGFKAALGLPPSASLSSADLPRTIERIKGRPMNRNLRRKLAAQRRREKRRKKR